MSVSCYCPALSPSRSLQWRVVPRWKFLFLLPVIRLPCEPCMIQGGLCGAYYQKYFSSSNTQQRAELSWSAFYLSVPAGRNPVWAALIKSSCGVWGRLNSANFTTPHQGIGTTALTILTIFVYVFILIINQFWNVFIACNKSYKQTNEIISKKSPHKNINKYLESCKKCHTVALYISVNRLLYILC